MTDLSQFKEEIRRRLPLSRVVGAHVRLKPQSRNSYSGLCPFHKEKTASFYVFDDNANYHCFGCGTHGDAIDFLERTENLTFLEALGKMAQMVGIPMPHFKAQGKESRSRLEAWYNIYEEAACYFEAQLMGPEAQGARTYLEGRLIAPGTWKTFRLGYAPRGFKLIDHLKAKGFDRDMIVESQLAQPSKDGRGGFYVPFQGRLMFPITDRMGKVIAFGGRILGPGQPKYLNSPETFLFHKGRELYNHEGARRADKALPLVVGEGYMDVIALHQMGGCRPVATLGTACTPDHLRLLWRLSGEPILCFDGDSAGKKALARVVETVLPLLKADHTVAFLKLPANKDPADLWEGGQGAVFHDLLKSPLSLFDFIWQNEVLDKDASTPEAKAKIEQALVSLVNTIDDKTLKSHAYGWAKSTLSSYFWKLGRSKTKFTGKMAPEASGASASLPRSTPQHKMTQIFMGLLIKYPQLVVEFEEEVFKFAVHSSKINEVKEEIIAFCHANKTIDNCTLSTHLKVKGYEPLVSEILSAVAGHGLLLKPGDSYEKAKEVWLRLITQQTLQEGKATDKERFHKNLIENLTPESWERVRHVQKEWRTQEKRIFQKDS